MAAKLAEKRFLQWPMPAAFRHGPPPRAKAHAARHHECPEPTQANFSPDDCQNELERNGASGRHGGRLRHLPAFASHIEDAREMISCRPNVRMRTRRIRASNRTETPVIISSFERWQRSPAVVNLLGDFASGGISIIRIDLAGTRNRSFASSSRIIMPVSSKGSRPFPAAELKPSGPHPFEYLAVFKMHGDEGVLSQHPADRDGIRIRPSVSSQPA